MCLAPTLPWMSGSSDAVLLELLCWGEVRGDGAADFAGEVSFEAAHDHLLGSPFSEPSCHVGLRWRVLSESADDDHVERPVGLAVAVAVQAVVSLPARRGVDR